MNARLVAACSLALGAGALAFVVARVGVAPIADAIAVVGAGFVLLLLYRLALIALMGASWRVLGDGGSGAGVLRFAWARLIRDSVSECLPLSPVGGFVFGGRALALAGVSAVWATASTVADVTIELAAQIFYVGFGLVMLARLRPHASIVHAVAVGLGLLTLGAALFALLQARGGPLGERVLGRAIGAGGRGGAVVRAVTATLAAIWRQPARVAACFALHGLDWIGNGVDAWLALALMRHPIGLRHAMVIDSLLYGLRSFAFMVPNALGVQEAGYVLLGAVFGLAPATALALSLLRRGRDFAIGVPALLAWQLGEGRVASRRRRRPGLAQAAKRASASAGDSCTRAS